MSEKKDYTPLEIYEGYYWLVLHTNPCCAPGGGRGNGCIRPRKYWRGEKPDWVKTNYPDTSINTWFIPSKDIPLFQVGNTEIKSWKDMKILWGDVKIKGTANRLYDRTPPDKAEQSPTTLDEAELWLNLRPNLTSDDFYRLCGDEILQAIETYLEKQHKKNLKELETLAQPGKGNWTNLIITIVLLFGILVLLDSIVTVVAWLMKWSELFFGAVFAAIPLILLNGIIAVVALFMKWFNLATSAGICATVAGVCAPIPIGIIALTKSLEDF